MRRSMCLMLLAGLLVVLASGDALTQPPGKGDKKGKDKAGRKFEIGTVIPPHIRPELELSAEQSKEIAELERLVRERLNKILSAEQKKKFEESGPPPKDKDKEGPPTKGKEKDTPPTAKQPNGIQWFATWEAGVAEAKRTNKPILLVSAAPHCAGVSGIW